MTAPETDVHKPLIDGCSFEVVKKSNPKVLLGRAPWDNSKSPKHVETASLDCNTFQELQYVTILASLTASAQREIVHPCGTYSLALAVT